MPITPRRDMKAAPTCILKSCPWANEGCCGVLGDCGAAHALDMASAPDGYTVLPWDNRTVEALKRAGLVSTERDNNGYWTVTTSQSKRKVA